MLALPDEFKTMLQAAPFDTVADLWQLVEGRYGIAGKAWLGRNDRFYLLTRLLHRLDAVHPWLYARCREVEAGPDGYLDLWAREHYKSTIITFAGIIQALLIDPELTVGIFSHTKPVARKFMLQIKQELEANRELQAVYPDVLYTDPRNESSKWSEEKGIVVRRRSNPKEASVEAHGLVDGQPTGAHFLLRVYDDVVTRESVSTPDQVAKTTSAWELSDNLGARGEDGQARSWHVGTRYSFADTYQSIMDRGALKVRIYAATDNGLPAGVPVLLSAEAWADRKLKQGPGTIACHCAGTTVLMADWTYKAIEDVYVGDEVVGFVTGTGKGNKTMLVKTTVVATNVRQAQASRYTLASGSTTSCTPDHKWWTKRSGVDGHNPYLALGTGRKQDLKALYRIASDADDDRDPRWQYLAGLFDGEGHCTAAMVTITQSAEHNPRVHARIGETLDGLGIRYARYERAAFTAHRKNSKASTIFILNGGRHMRHRLLLNARPAKDQALIDSLYCHIGGKSKTERDPVVRIEQLGIQTVYNIQTVTGNYIANGYASKNCQMLQNPAAGNEAMFRKEWLSFIDIRPATLNVYIMVDPAHSKKKGSDNTAMAVVGIDSGGNKYLLDGYRHKMGLRERWEALKGLRKVWLAQPGVQMVKCGYERYGMQADLEYFEEQMQRDKDAFEIVELNWTSDGAQAKDDRVQRLQPDFMAHKFFLAAVTPTETSNQKRIREQGQAFRIFKPVNRRDHEGNVYSLNKGFLEEFLTYPFSAKKDLIDATSRLYDMEPVAPALIDERMLEPETYADGM